jgi:branched-chain amino acid transport system substrate-binding protein
MPLDHRLVPRRWMRLVIVGSCGALLLAACGSSGGSGNGSSGSTGSSGSSGSQQGISGKTVTLGVSYPASGPQAPYAGIGQGFEAYFKYLNSQGGVNGYKFSFKTEDNQGTALGGATATRSILQANPFLVFIQGSPQYEGSADLMKAQGGGVPTMAIADAGVVQAAGIPNSYGLGPNYNTESEFESQFLKTNLHITDAAIAYEDDAVGQGAGAEAPKWGAANGVKITAVAIPPTTTNFAPLAAKLQSTGAKAVEVFAITTLLAGLQKAASAIGYSPKWITFASNFDASYPQLAGAASNGTYIDAFCDPTTDNTPQAALFRNEINKYASGADSTFGAYGWSFAAVIAQAIKNATSGGHSLTRSDYISALNSLDAQNVGLLFSANYTTGDHSSLIQGYKEYRVQNGNFVAVTPNVIPIPSS